MSKLSNAIEARQTGKVKLVDGYTVITVEDAFEKKVSMDRFAATEYLVSAQFAVHGFAQDGEELKYLVQHAKRAIIHEVFGEFRSLLIQIERAAYDRDFHKVRDLTRQLDTEMFS